MCFIAPVLLFECVYLGTDGYSTILLLQIIAPNGCGKNDVNLDMTIMQGNITIVSGSVV